MKFVWLDYQSGFVSFCQAISDGETIDENHYCHNWCEEMKRINTVGILSPHQKFLLKQNGFDFDCSSTKDAGSTLEKDSSNNDIPSTEKSLMQDDGVEGVIEALNNSMNIDNKDEDAESDILVCRKIFFML